MLYDLSSEKEIMYMIIINNATYCCPFLTIRWSWKRVWQPCRCQSCSKPAVFAECARWASVRKVSVFGCRSGNTSSAYPFYCMSYIDLFIYTISRSCGGSLPMASAVTDPYQAVSPPAGEYTSIAAAYVPSAVCAWGRATDRENQDCHQQPAGCVLVCCVLFHYIKS